MNISSNEIVVDRITLPILTIYQNGEVIDSIVGIVEMLGNYFIKDEIIHLLEDRIPNM